MKQLWTFLVLLSSVLLVVTISTPIEIERIEIEWLLIIVFLLSLTRLIYYDRKILIFRIVMILIVGGLLFNWKSQLNLEHSWIPSRELYQTRQVKGRTIEVQTQATNEWPRRRIVKRVPLLPFIYWKTEMDGLSVIKLDTLTWSKVNHSIAQEN